MSETSVTVPSVLTAGDSWSLSAADGRYPSTGDWFGRWYFIGEKTSFSITADPNGDDYAGTMLPAATADLQPGLYRWVFVVASIDAPVEARYTLAQGFVEVKADPSAVINVDPRT